MIGAAVTPITTIRVTNVNRVVNTALASSQVSRSLRRAWYSANTGIKAEAMDPSARSSRNRLGTR